MILSLILLAAAALLATYLMLSAILYLRLFVPEKTGRPDTFDLTPWEFQATWEPPSLGRAKPARRIGLTPGEGVGFVSLPLPPA